MVPEQVSNDPPRSNPTDRSQTDNQTRSLWFNFMRNVARSRLIWGTALIAVVTTAVAVTFLVTQFGYNQVLTIILLKMVFKRKFSNIKLIFYIFVLVDPW